MTETNSEQAEKVILKNSVKKSKRLIERKREKAVLFQIVTIPPKNIDFIKADRNGLSTCLRTCLGGRGRQFGPSRITLCQSRFDEKRQHKPARSWSCEGRRLFFVMG